MKIKALIATLIGAVAIQGATAGEWSPPVLDKCPVDCCADNNGSLTVGYDTEYVFKGVRLAEDVVWADVNYTFDNLPLPVNIGAWHLTSLSSNGLGYNGAYGDNYGDETNLYASVELPSLCGFDHGLTYTYFMFPNRRQPTGTAGNGADGRSQLTYAISREVFCGVRLSYSLDYLFGATGNGPAGGHPLPLGAGPRHELGGFMHTIDLAKSLDITDCLALDLNAGVLYNDNYYDTNIIAGHSLAGNRGNDSGWHSYYLRAALPVALSGCATLTPYIQYNGTPDGWTGDDMGTGTRSQIANRNDVFFGGVSVNVGF